MNLLASIRASLGVKHNREILGAIAALQAGQKRTRPTGEYPQDFERIWVSYPEREGPNPKQLAFKAWRARIKEGVKPEDLVAGVDRYRYYLATQDKEGTEFVMMASTFFGAGERWKDEYKTNGKTKRITDKNAPVYVPGVPTQTDEPDGPFISFINPLR